MTCQCGCDAEAISPPEEAARAEEMASRDDCGCGCGCGCGDTRASEAERPELEQRVVALESATAP